MSQLIDYEGLRKGWMM